LKKVCIWTTRPPYNRSACGKRRCLFDTAKA
jgi:hypothetical protein